MFYQKPCTLNSKKSCKALDIKSISVFQQTLIIPDPCYYHKHETTKIFDLFYELTTAEGYHPSPTKLNFIITIVIGMLLGLIIGKIFTQKPQKKQHH